MKVAFDNIVFSLQKSGGISVVWQELVSRALKSHPDEVEFWEYESAAGNIFRSLIDIPAGKIHTLSPLLFILDRYRNLRIRNKAPFVFHSSYFRTCLSRNALNVTTVHDFTYDRYFRGRKKLAFVHILQRNRAIRKSDAVVCISWNTRKDLFKFVPDVDPKKVFVINNGVSEDYHVIGDSIPEYKDWILFVGGRENYKNGRKLASLLSGTGYNVLFCGSPMSDDERSHYDGTLGPDHYKVISNLSNQELNRIYNSCRCLVYPSSYEGFGIPVLEAQRAGCPVIACNNSSIPEVIGDCSMLMDDLTKESLLEKLSVLDDPQLREKIIAAGLKNSERFNWERTYSEYEALYESLLNSKGMNL